MSFDIIRTAAPLSYTATFFASRVLDPIHVELTDTGLILTNLDEPTSNYGIELLTTLLAGPICRHRHLHVCAGPRARRTTPP